MVYAHYSFQIQFDANGDYSVYMDGCCRPDNLQNNFGLPFHLRAGIQLYAENQIGGAARPYPKQSIIVNMPNVAMLRTKGFAYDECKEFLCETVNGVITCFSRFQVQAYHPLEEYRKNIRTYLELLFLQ